MNKSYITDLVIVLGFIVLIAYMMRLNDKNSPRNPNKLSKSCYNEVAKLRDIGPTSNISIITGLFSGIITYIILRLLTNIDLNKAIGLSILSSVLTFFLTYKGINCWQNRTLAA